MKIFYYAALLTFLSAPALAFSVDEDGSGSPAKAQLTDPDDKLPTATFSLSGSGTAKNNSQDAASVHYDYDPSNGTFVLRATKDSN